jgi:hypothetical protein
MKLRQAVRLASGENTRLQPRVQHSTKSGIVAEFRGSVEADIGEGKPVCRLPHCGLKRAIGDWAPEDFEEV